MMNDDDDGDDDDDDDGDDAGWLSMGILMVLLLEIVHECALDGQVEVVSCCIDSVSIRH